MKQQEQDEEWEEEEDEEEEYEVEQVDIIREAASLDDMAKLITVEEVCTLSCFSVDEKGRVTLSDLLFSKLCYIDLMCLLFIMGIC